MPASAAVDHVSTHALSRGKANVPSRQTAYPGPCIAASSGCLVSAGPFAAFNALGDAHTFSFVCGAAAASLTGPSAAPYPTTGCFDVTATVSDLTSGGLPAILSGACGGRAASVRDGLDCASVANPICATGATSSSGSCGPVCPSGFTFQSDGQCHAAPTGAPPTCPANSTPVTNSAGVAIDCVTIPETTSPDTASVTINPGAPHAYAVEFRGYVGTESNGTCPSGTSLTANVNLTPTGGAAFFGPACFFDVSAEKKYLEVTNLQVIQTTPCGGSIAAGFVGIAGGAVCRFEVLATGTVVLKEGVDCTDGSEPTSGAPADFPLGSVYSCTDGSLRVVDVPVPNAIIHLTAQNGIFSPTCYPSAFQPTAVGSPTPTSAVPPTATPTPVPTTPAPTPTGTPTSTVQSAFCTPPGISTTDIVTNSLGLAGGLGTEVEYSATASPPVAAQNSNETVQGNIALDGMSLSGIASYYVFHFIFGDRQCNDVLTGGNGSSSCTQYVDSQPGGSNVPVNVSFVYNCSEFALATSFPVEPVNTPTPTPGASSGSTTSATGPAPNGVCVLRTGYGQVIITASLNSVTNNQPALSTGPVILGTYGVATSTPVPTAPAIAATAPPTAVPTVPPVAATSTPVPPPPTSTPVPTATVVPTVGPPPPLPTATATPVKLSFSVDGVRVAPKSAPNSSHPYDQVYVGQQVSLVIYYSIYGMPRTMTATTLYDIKDSGGRVVYRVSFTHKEKKGTAGHFIRYTWYTPPAALPFGLYTLYGTYSIDGRSQTRSWHFALVRSMTLAAATKQADIAVAAKQSNF